MPWGFKNEISGLPLKKTQTTQNNQQTKPNPNQTKNASTNSSYLVWKNENLMKKWLNNVEVIAILKAERKALNIQFYFDWVNVNFCNNLQF